MGDGCTSNGMGVCNPRPPELMTTIHDTLYTRGKTDELQWTGYGEFPSIQIDNTPFHIVSHQLHVKYILLMPFAPMQIQFQNTFNGSQNLH